MCRLFFLIGLLLTACVEKDPDCDCYTKCIPCESREIEDVFVRRYVYEHHECEKCRMEREK